MASVRRAVWGGWLLGLTADAGGGFVEYHEETGSPKVGYAVYLNPKSDRPLVMGSGFHGKE